MRLNTRTGMFARGPALPFTLESSFPTKKCFDVVISCKNPVPCHRRAPVRQQARDIAKQRRLAGAGRAEQQQRGRALLVAVTVRRGLGDLGQQIQQHLADPCGTGT